MANQKDAPSKMYSEDTIAVLLAVNGINSISSAQYDMMSALDGTKTANSFQHQFRAILRKARDIKARVDSGEGFTPVTPSKKRGADDGKGNSGPSTPSKKARATPKKSGTKMKAETKTCKPEKSAGSDSEAAKMENDDHGFELQGSYVKTEVEWDDDREDYI